jgi:fused signal recognition particle receptor
MEELKKIKRIIAKQMDGAPHEILLILDATTGQNALSQTRLFHQELEVTGLVLTKLDGTAKGGIAVGVCHAFQIPIRFIGLGEGLDDLKPFDPEQFVAALFE